MKMKEITELSTDELLTKRRDLRQESFICACNSRAASLNSQAGYACCGGILPAIETELSQRGERD